MVHNQVEQLASMYELAAHCAVAIEIGAARVSLV